jgi:WD40 repeat protein
MTVLHMTPKSAKLSQLGFSPDGRTLAAGSHAGVFLWSGLAGGPELVEVPSGGMQFAFSPDGRTLFASGTGGQDDDAVFAVDLTTGKTARVPLGETYTQAFAVSPDGSVLVTAVKDIGYAGQVACWEVGSYRKPQWAKKTTLGLGHGVAFAGPDRVLVTELAKAGGRFDTHLVTREVATGRVTATSPNLADHPERWAVSANGRTLAATTQNRLHAYRVDGDWAAAATRGPGRKHFTDLAVDPRGERVAAAVDGQVLVYDTATWVAEVVPIDIRARSVAFSPDGTRAAAAAATGQVQVWVTGEPTGLKAEKK